MLAVLASYSPRDEDALHAARGLRSVAHGFGIPLDLDESFDRLPRAFVAGLRKGGSWIPSRGRLGALRQRRREDQTRHLLRLVQLREVASTGQQEQL